MINILIVSYFVTVFFQVILVGHSAGGLSITQASHKFGKKIRLAVYVGATMLKLGFCTDQDVKDVKPLFLIWLLFYFILDCYNILFTVKRIGLSTSISSWCWESDAVEEEITWHGCQLAAQSIGCQSLIYPPKINANINNRYYLNIYIYSLCLSYNFNK